jgi:hypothetical protein
MSNESEPKSSKHSIEDELQICPTRLLEDTPAEDDLLAFHQDIGPHARVAQAISEVILSPDESGGKMIGLEGGWGAGKTTVINLLRKHLVVKPNITVFSFDAWAHEGDPLRRTYLESLIRHFQNIKWIDKKHWDKTLEKLAKRRRVTKTRTVQKITTLGKLFAISAFFVPLGAPLLLTSLRQELPSIWIGIGSALTGAPLILLFGNLIRILIRIGWNRLVKKKYGRESPDKQKDDEQVVSDWAFLSGNAINVMTQDTTETPEPTSIEFEDIFHRLMQTALSESSQRQTVIVLDNLDRVDPKDARSIWATLQTFLQERSTKTEQWFKKLWIIVPYDPSGLRQLWANRGVAEEDYDKKRNVPATDWETAEQDVSVSFIDKSFLLRFEVPPPVLSNWKAYLLRLVEEALPEHPVEDRHTIYRVFDMCRAKDSEPPTPRELKLYVNQIGAIHRQWQHEFPIGHVAYYVILRRKYVNIRKGLPEGKLPKLMNIESILSPNLRYNLAGLAFNVRAEFGQQLLLGAPIYDALAKNKAEELKDLEKRHQDGFWAVLESDAILRLADADATTVANAALCLDQLNILENQKQSKTGAIIIEELGRAASHVENWSPFGENIAKGIATVCRFISDLGVTKKVVEALRQTILSLEKKEETPAVTEGVIAGIANICEQIDVLGHRDVLDSPFTLPVDAQGWIEVCSLIKMQEPKFWEFFQPKASFDEISKILCEAVTKGQFLDKNLTALQVTQASPSINCNWESLAEAFEQRLNASLNVNSEEANVLLHGLSLLRRYKYDNAKAATKRLADGGHLMHGLHQAQSQNNAECKAWFIVTFLEQQPSAAMPQVVGNSKAGHNTLMTLLNTDDTDLAKHMVEILRAQNNLGLLFTIVLERDQYDPIVLRCHRLVADSEKSEVLYTPQAIIERWKALREHLNGNESAGRFDKLIGHLCATSSLVEDVQKAEDGFKHEDAGLYLAICKTSSVKSFHEWCRDGLETLDASKWKSELDNEGDALKLMLALMDAGISVVLKQQYQDALVDHAKSVLAGSVQPSNDLVSRRTKILDSLGTKAARKVLRDRLLNAAMEQDGKCANGFFEMYDEEIADYATLTKNKEIVAKLFSPLVRERAIGGLRWLRDVFSNNPKLLDKYTDKASVQDFRERLQGEIDKPAKMDDEAHALTVEIATTLGITPKEKLTEDEAATEDDTPEAVDSEEENAKGKNEK